jgi:hypothetical protein
LKLEKLKEAEQWKVFIKDISQHGIGGIPLESVLTILKVCYFFMLFIYLLFH